MADPPSSRDARLQGNELFKAGRLLEAIQQYETAASLSATDAAPLANLAAAYFELGKYDISNQFAAQAIGKLGSDATSNASRNRLNARRTRAHMHLRQYDKARESLNLCDSPWSGDLISINEELTHSAAKPLTHHVDLDLNAVQRPAINRPSAQKHHSQDKPFSLFDTSLMDDNVEQLNFLFAGSTDPRHLLATIIHIGDPALQMPTKLKYSLTVTHTDICMVARSMVMLLLLAKMSVIGDIDVAVTLFYWYLAPLFPQEVNTIIQNQFSEAIDMLEGRQVLPSWLVIPAECRVQLLKTFKQWQRSCDTDVPPAMFESLLNYGKADEATNSAELFPARLKEEAISYRRTGLLPTSTHPVQDHTNLVRKIATTDLSGFAIAKDVSLPIDWKLNLSMANNEPSAQVKAWSQLVSDPFDFASKITTSMPTDKSTLFDIVSKWYNQVAVAIHRLEDRICVTLQCEHILTGLSANQQSPSPVIEEERSTSGLCDRILLSDAPDSAGGTLFVTLFAIPALRKASSSYVTWKSSCTTGAYKDWSAYDRKTLHLNTHDTSIFQQEVQQLLGSRIDADTYHNDTSSVLFERECLPGYRRARHAMQDRPNSALLARARINTWLRRVYQALVTPHASIENATVRPLNSSAFIMILKHLWQLGYPAHWLGDTIAQIFDEAVTADSGDVSQIVSKLLTRSSSGLELISTLALCYSQLPFGIVHKSIWQLRAVVGSICFDGMVVFITALDTLILIFSEPAITLFDIKQTMHVMDAADNKTAELPTHNQFQVLSAFSFDEQSTTAQFALESTMVDIMRDQDWNISLWTSTGEKLSNLITVRVVNWVS